MAFAIFMLFERAKIMENNMEFVVNRVKLLQTHAHTCTLINTNRCRRECISWMDRGKGKKYHRQIRNIIISNNYVFRSLWLPQLKSWSVFRLDKNKARKAEKENIKLAWTHLINGLPTEITFQSIISFLSWPFLLLLLFSPVLSFASNLSPCHLILIPSTKGQDGISAN